jgi:hypothetical protein
MCGRRALTSIKRGVGRVRLGGVEMPEKSPAETPNGVPDLEARSQ